MKLFYDTALSCPDNFKTFCPFPAAKDREAYEALPAALREQLVKEGEEKLHYAYPAICATDFMNFCRTGDRVHYETPYFAKRNALNDLILAECAEHKGRFLDDIINGIYAVCEESAWQLPPHNSYFRDKPQHILPDVTRPVLDLFACETGALLACAAYLLKEELDAVSPFIVTMIGEALLRRIIRPYLSYHFWWMGQGDEPMCNWTVWCTQNVLLTAFLTPWSDASLAELPLSAILRKASESCDYFLKDYGEDGCCDEGAQYYRHAGLCLFGAMSILDAVTDGAFASLFRTEKIRNIAMYILNVHVDGKYYFNFSDCSPVAGRAGVREFLFGKATGQETLCLFAAKDFQAEPTRLISDEVNGANLFYRMQTVFHYREIMEYDSSPRLHHKDVYYPSVGLFLVHGENLDLAVKTGDNDDSHNHNDTGSITLYRNGCPVLVDIGVETYTGKTFSDRRYEIWTMQSGYHNLPTICGTDQMAGAAYRATDVHATLAGNPTISMELAGAYPLTQPVSYVRTVTLDKKENRVVLTDRTDAAPVILNFIACDKPCACPDSRCLNIGGASFCFEGASLLAVETLPITDARLMTAWDHDLYRIRLRMEGGCFRLTVH